MGDEFKRAPIYPEASSTRRPPRAPLRPWLLWLGLLSLALPILLVVVTNYLSELFGAVRSQRSAHARTMIAQLGVAFDLYQKEYGHCPPPAVSDNVKIHVLFNGANVEGANRRAIQFFVFNHKEVSVKGEMLDPWGTPYRITYDVKGPIITSGGPDRAFGTKDDITNRR